MNKNTKLNLVINPPVGVCGITNDKHDFLTVEVGSESQECLAWFMLMLQEYVVSEVKVNENDKPVEER